MDKINFTAKDNFPLSSDTMDMMQRMVGLSANMALLGGSNYILSGCVDDGTVVSDGIIIINGELLAFEGGTKKSKITIVQTTQTLHAFGVDYPEAYIFRTAKFSDTGEFGWSDFAQVLTNKQIENRLNSIRGDEPGTIKEWGGLIAKIPSDYMLCDGRELSVDDYPELFNNIGVTYGGNGTNSFRIPDCRGRFTVGYDNSRQDYNDIGKTGGEEKHVLTVSEIPSHNHVNHSAFNRLSARAADASNPGTPGSVDTNSTDTEYNVGRMNPAAWTNATIQDVGGNIAHENRPPYVVFAKIIKVK